MSKGLNRRISFDLHALWTSAIQENDTEEMWRLLKNNRQELDLNAANHGGLTALHQSVVRNNLDAVKILLCYGADVNRREQIRGFAPLHAASACGFLHVASLLILFGADMFQVTHDGDTPLDLAKDFEMQQFLTEHTIDLLQTQETPKGWILYQLNNFSCSFQHLLTFFGDVALRLCALLFSIVLLLGILVVNSMCKSVCKILKRFKPHKSRPDMKATPLIVPDGNHAMNLLKDD